MAEKISPAATPWWFLILLAANIPMIDLYRVDLSMGLKK